MVQRTIVHGDGRAISSGLVVLLVAMTMGLLSGCERDTSSAPGKSFSQTKRASSSDPSENDQELRLVSLGGTVTEIVYALGAGDHVVAVDQSSVYPEATEEVRHLDLFRKVSAESVLSYDPTLVLATEAAEPDSAFKRLREAGVDVHRFTNAEGLESARSRIRAIGDVLDRREEADQIIETLTTELEEAREMASRCREHAETLFLYARGRGTLYVAGTGTSAQRMVELAGAEPIPTSIEGFKPMSAEALMETSPEVILMTESGLQSIGGRSGLADVKGLGETPAVRDGRIVTRGDLALLGFGPRTGRVASTLSEQLCLSAHSDRDREQ